MTTHPNTDRSCDICGDHQDLHELTDDSLDHWRMMECRRCGFVFLQNPPPYKQLEADFAWEKTAEKVTSKRYSNAPVQAVIAGSTKKLRRSIFIRRKIRDLI